MRIKIIDLIVNRWYIERTCNKKFKILNIQENENQDECEFNIKLFDGDDIYDVRNVLIIISIKKGICGWPYNPNRYTQRNIMGDFNNKLGFYFILEEEISKMYFKFR